MEVPEDLVILMADAGVRGCYLNPCDTAPNGVKIMFPAKVARGGALHLALMEHRGDLVALAKAADRGVR